MTRKSAVDISYIQSLKLKYNNIIVLATGWPRISFKLFTKNFHNKYKLKIRKCFIASIFDAICGLFIS